MSAVLSACCTCGATVSAPCPTLEERDMDAAYAAIEAAGFVWHERLGYRCGAWPACEVVSRSGGREDEAAPAGEGRDKADTRLRGFESRPDHQLDLFGRVA